MSRIFWLFANTGKEAVFLYFENEKDNNEYQVIGETLLGEDVIYA